jgi:hypothetical protein
MNMLNKTAYVLALFCAPLALSLGCKVTVSEGDFDGGSLFDPEPEETATDTDTDTESETDTETETESDTGDSGDAEDGGADDTDDTGTATLDAGDTDDTGAEETDAGATDGEDTETPVETDAGMPMEMDGGSDVDNSAQCSASAEAADESSCDECTYILCCDERVACDNDSDCPAAWASFTDCTQNDPERGEGEDTRYAWYTECFYMYVVDIPAAESLALCAADSYDSSVQPEYGDKLDGDGLCAAECFNMFVVEPVE